MLNNTYIMKYLKLYKNDIDYQNYANSDDYIIPNVSYAKDTDIVYYNKAKETRLVCTYNVTDTTNSTKLCNTTSNFTSMEVDGVLLDNATTGYTFDTVGEHTVKFELVDTTSIGVVAFQNCSNLTSINIPDSVTSIGDAAFIGCTGLISVKIGSEVTSIGNMAFYNCSNVKELYYNAPIPVFTSLVQDGMREKLEKVVIGNSTPGINDTTFYSCYNLTSVEIGSGVTSIGTRAFAGCSKLTSITIPDSVTSIGDNIFYGCTSLTSVKIGSGVNFIDDLSFYNCTNLTSITIPDSVTSIGYNAFGSCSGLISITIPDSITSIDGSAFNRCHSLNEITCLATTAPSISSDTFQYIKENGILKVPTGSDYSTWMNTDANYLGYYNWTVQEI